MKMGHHWLSAVLVGMSLAFIVGCSSNASSQPEFVGKWQHKVANDGKGLPNQKTAELLSFLFNVAPNVAENACRTMFDLGEGPSIRLAFKDGSALDMALELRPGQKITIGDDDFSASGSWTLNNTDGNRLRVNIKQASSGKAKEFWLHFSGGDRFSLTAVGANPTDGIPFERITAK